MKKHELSKTEYDDDRARWVCTCGMRGGLVRALPNLTAKAFAELAFVYHAGSAWNEDGSVRE